MNLERVIAVRTNETVYRGGDQCVKVFGDGFTNWFWPTAAVCMASLGAGNIEYTRWAKFIWKPMLALNIAAGILVFIAQVINYGPF